MNDEKILRASFGSSKTPLQIGKLKIPCYVLENGIRVLSGRGIQNALGISPKVAGDRMVKMLASKPFSANLSEKSTLILCRLQTERIEFIRPDAGGAVATTYGYEATLLIDIADLLIEAKKAGILSEKQMYNAECAETIIRATAKVGIIALIDEQTGYTEHKQKTEYRDKWREFIRQDAAEYEKEFPDELFDIFYKIYGYPRTANRNQHPLFFAKLIRKYIYEPLANSNGAILEMLDENNPVIITETGRKRKYKLFQFLDTVVGKPKLRQQLWQFIGMGKAATNKRSLERNFNRVFCKPSWKKKEHWPTVLPDIDDE